MGEVQNRQNKPQEVMNPQFVMLLLSLWIFSLYFAPVLRFSFHYWKI